MFNTLYKKCLELAAHKSSKYYLAIVSFVESSFSNTARCNDNSNGHFKKMISLKFFS